jgi:hypothetical protein
MVWAIVMRHIERTQRLWNDVSRFRNERSPMVTPSELVRKTGLAIGHVKASMAACVMN